LNTIDLKNINNLIKKVGNSLAPLSPMGRGKGEGVKRGRGDFIINVNSILPRKK
jgi:hypothetical protein